MSESQKIDKNKEEMKAHQQQIVELEEKLSRNISENINIITQLDIL